MWKDPGAPHEVGWFIPEPAPGRVAPQTNDVDVDERGLIYIADRYLGFDILELNRGWGRAGRYAIFRECVVTTSVARRRSLPVTLVRSRLTSLP